MLSYVTITAPMNTLLYRAIPWTIILLPFLILGLGYHSLPAEIMIFRHLDGTADYAPKSLFTVFRVPLIEVICGLAVEIMRRRAAKVAEHKSSYLMWTVPLYTVAVKTLLQALEMISSGQNARIFFYLTAAAVAIGIICTIFTARKAFTGLKHGAWKLELWEKAALSGLLISYLFLAFLTNFL
jgi:uncharacterized membrane protein